MSNGSTTYVGMDTAKKSIQVAMLLPERDKPLEWEVANDARGLKRLKQKFQPLVSCACATRRGRAATRCSAISAQQASTAL